MPVELKKNVKSINESITPLVNTNTCHAGSERSSTLPIIFIRNMQSREKSNINSNTS